MDKNSKKQLDMWHRDPNNWRFGFFYYNKEDSRLFPPKRNAALGWTVNFANTKSVLAFVTFLIFFGFIILIITFYEK